MNTYYLIGDDGQTFGPVDENGLIQWVREGRVRETSQIRCVETGVVVAAVTLPFITSVFAQSRPPVPPALTGAATNSSHQLTSFPVVVVILLHFLTCGLFSLIWLNLLHGKLPRIRSDDPSGGRALGFCFIPFFNLYWIFFTYHRLGVRVNEQREVYGLPPSSLSGMAITASIFQIIPYLNILVGYTIILPIFLALMQSSVNQLVAQSATTSPRKILPAQPAAPGMPGWGIALIVSGCLVFFIAIMAALLLPALASAKQKAQRINCVNNLKQIGLAFRIWEGDHNDQFPFNVSTNNGGTMELCALAKDGFDQNGWLHFQVISNELGSPKILVCPADSSCSYATDFSHLQAMNVSYQIRSGTNITDRDPQSVLAICPFHRNVLFSDGSVMQLSKPEMLKLEQSLAKPQ